MFNAHVHMNHRTVMRMPCHLYYCEMYFYFVEKMCEFIIKNVLM